MALQYLGPEAGVGARQEGPRQRSSIPSSPPDNCSVQTPPNTSPDPDTDHVPDNQNRMEELCSVVNAFVNCSTHYLGEDSKSHPGSSHPWNLNSQQHTGHPEGNQDVSSQRGAYLYYQTILSLIFQEGPTTLLLYGKNLITCTSLIWCHRYSVSPTRKVFFGPLSRFTMNLSLPQAPKGKLYFSRQESIPIYQTIVVVQPLSHV